MSLWQMHTFLWTYSLALGNRVMHMISRGYTKSDEQGHTCSEKKTTVVLCAKVASMHSYQYACKEKPSPCLCTIAKKRYRN